MLATAAILYLQIVIYSVTYVHGWHGWMTDGTYIRTHRRCAVEVVCVGLTQACPTITYKMYVRTYVFILYHVIQRLQTVNEWRRMTFDGVRSGQNTLEQGSGTSDVWYDRRVLNADVQHVKQDPLYEQLKVYIRKLIRSRAIQQCTM